MHLGFVEWVGLISLLLGMTAVSAAKSQAGQAAGKGLFSALLKRLGS